MINNANMAFGDFRTSNAPVLTNHTDSHLVAVIDDACDQGDHVKIRSLLNDGLLRRSPIFRSLKLNPKVPNALELAIGTIDSPNRQDRLAIVRDILDLLFKIKRPSERENVKRHLVEYLRHAALAGDCLIFHLLNEVGATIPAHVQKRHDLLVHALRGGSVMIVSDIVAQGPIGNKPTHKLAVLAAGWHPCSQANTDRANLVDVMLSYGAPARCSLHTTQYPSALTVGIYRDDLPLVHCLLSSDDSKELLRTNPWDASYSRMTKRTALHFVKSLDMLNLLTQFGLDLNGCETDEFLPLQIVADGDEEEKTRYCRLDMFRYVLDRTYDVDAQNNRGQTALDYCYAMEDPDTPNNIQRIELLLEKGATPPSPSPPSASVFDNQNLWL